MNNGARAYFLAAFDGIYTALKGMAITVKYLNIFREKPITLCYPDVSPFIETGFRGKHIYVKETCIACRMCEKACPVDCIAIDMEGKGKKAVIHSYRIDYTKCLFCNLCVEACPVDCVWMGGEWDLTQYSRDGCGIELIDEANAELKMPEKTKVAKPPKPAPNPKPAAEEKQAEEPKSTGEES